MKVRQFRILYVACPEGILSVRYYLFLYINDLKNVSNTLDPIIFTDDTNLFISDKTLILFLPRQI